MKLTQENLKAVLDYDPETGLFRRRKGGQGAGTFDSGGYVQIRVHGIKYGAHRLAWLYVHGVWPKGDLDHRNNIRTDNRIENLRIATDFQNCANQKRRITNRSGFKGVVWHKASKLWLAKIRVEGKCISLGYWDTAEEAAEAYRNAAMEYFPEFYRIA